MKNKEYLFSLGFLEYFYKNIHYKSRNSINIKRELNNSQSLLEKTNDKFG
ncbi:6323_t:CDS:2 [Entrophospora sp. SA101]|nr:6323_t:CDS:2 [Entrophospora sp. SA101]